MRRIRECRDCGLFQEVPPLDVGATARCCRCEAVLQRMPSASLGPSLACVLAATTLFAFALELPFMDIRVMGRFSRAGLLTGPAALDQHGATALAVAVLATLIVFPAARMLLLLAVLAGLRLARPPRVLPRLFTWAHKLNPWAMLEVFMLGVIVAYSRLTALAQIDVGQALGAIAGAMVALVAADASLDVRAMWDVFEERGLVSPPREPRTPSGDDAPRLWMGCGGCERVSFAVEGEACSRCGHRLHRRKKNGIARTWALTSAAALLYLPANLLPVMTVRRFGHGDPNTILSGIGELASAHLWPLAILVFVASFTVPMLKLVSLATMLVMAHRKSDRGLKLRTRLFRFILVVGRWSMIDVFALMTLVAVVRLGFLASILPGDGATAFCGVVLLTMMATELFDARIMWDAAGESNGAGQLATPAEVGAT